MTPPIAVDRELLERYRTSAPRYTSYPTAADWTDAFDPTTYPELLAGAATRADEPLSVYVHLPFCQELCLFCGCNVVITRSRDRVGRYLEAVERELVTVRESGVGVRAVRQLHWGGGTPTHLTCAEIERLFGALTDVFPLAEDAEIAIEVDPRVTTAEQIALLASLGFNRVSMGVQDFDPAVQKAVKRVQSIEATRAVVDRAREAGMESVNIDLMYGLPGQTRAGFARTLETVLDIAPERVALFHYAHVPWMKRHQTAMSVEAMPDPSEKLALFVDAVDAFHDAGYVYLGLDHFALPDDELARAAADKTLDRNFMGYATRRGTEMVGVGVSSIGDVDGAYVQNAPREADYLAAVAERGHGAARGHVLTPEDRLRRRVILGLMCNGEVKKRAIEQAFDVDFDATFAQELEALAPLEDDGLCHRDPDALRLTPLGQIFMRNVAVVFDRYYAARTSRGDNLRETFSKTL